MAPVHDFKQLRMYALSFEGAMQIFDASGAWPRDERYSLTDQIRRSSRSVCANIAEAWRKRLYVPSFVSKLSDASAEAAETMVWLDFAHQCGYLDAVQHAELSQAYDTISGGLIKMLRNPDPWCGPALKDERAEYSVQFEGAAPDDEISD
jgi:four helix bundle protein